MVDNHSLKDVEPLGLVIVRKGGDCPFSINEMNWHLLPYG